MDRAARQAELRPKHGFTGNDALQYEHLVQINDPLNPLLETLTPEQVWAGLLLRAEQPQLFVTGLERCTILSRNGDTFERELSYGPASVRDKVTLTMGVSVRYDIVATDNYVGGSLTMSIEQPDAAQLFIRFKYETTLQAEDGEYNRTLEIVKSAYREADIDTVKLIREFALTGKLPLDRPSTDRMH